MSRGAPGTFSPSASRLLATVLFAGHPRGSGSACDLWQLHRAHGLWLDRTIAASKISNNNNNNYPVTANQPETDAEVSASMLTIANSMDVEISDSDSASSGSADSSNISSDEETGVDDDDDNDDYASSAPSVGSAPAFRRSLPVTTPDEERICILKLPMNLEYLTINHPLRHVTSVNDLTEGVEGDVIYDNGKGNSNADGNGANDIELQAAPPSGANTATALRQVHSAPTTTAPGSQSQQPADPAPVSADQRQTDQQNKEQEDEESASSSDHGLQIELRSRLNQGPAQTPHSTTRSSSAPPPPRRLRPPPSSLPRLTASASLDLGNWYDDLTAPRPVPSSRHSRRRKVSNLLHSVGARIRRFSHPGTKKPPRPS